MIERVDSAVFGPVPAFVRVSIRLAGIDPARAAASAGAARAVLARAVAAVRAAPVDPADARLAAWRDAYADVGLPSGTVPPVQALLAWAATAGGVPSQGVVADLVNALSLQHVAPTAAYDGAGIQGDLWLRPSRGIERYQALREVAGRPAEVEINELILADSADDVVARAWHGSPGRQAVVGEATRTCWVHVDLLAPATGSAAAIAAAGGRLLAGFLGARADAQIIDRASPQARWAP